MQSKLYNLAMKKAQKRPHKKWQCELRGLNENNCEQYWLRIKNKRTDVCTIPYKNDLFYILSNLISKQIKRAITLSCIPLASTPMTLSFSLGLSLKTKYCLHLIDCKKKKKKKKKAKRLVMI